MPTRKLIEVDADNVEQTSFFCLASQPESVGYRKKLAWLRERFAEGLRIHMLGRRGDTRWEGERGFIEYIPGARAWRGVEAEDDLFIHCLWVVGKSRGRGGAGRLLDACERDARAQGFAGMATLAGERPFATSAKFYAAHGFEAVAEHAPALTLMVRRFQGKRKPLPRFASGVVRGPGHYKTGLTLFTTDQCPYIEGAARRIREAAAVLGLDPARTIRLRSAADVRKRCPNPYGTFTAVLHGQLLTYYSMSEKQLMQRIDELAG